MSSQLILTVDKRGVATLTMNRPDVHNAFNNELIAEMALELQQLDNDDAVRAVVLTGAGESFSAGADLNWMRSMAKASRAENHADALALASLMRSLNYLTKPTLARVNGSCYGGGVGLIACCDIVISSENARFGITETRLGLVPAVVGPYVLRRIGEAAARRYFLSAEIFAPERARQMGLVSEVVGDDALDSAIEAQLAALLKTGPKASRYAKYLINAIGGVDEKRQRKLDNMTAALISELRISEEGQEGLNAFLEKRRPAWRGAETSSKSDADSA